MPASFVLDSYALIAFYRDEKSASSVDEILQLGRDSKAEIFVSEISVGEVYYMIYKKNSQKMADEVLANLWALPIKYVLPDRQSILTAAKFKASAPLSYADCFVLELAQKKDATIVTSDPEFKQFEKEVKIKWI
ncbi:MAG: type II toxin-antitoxin system VapC family toxin [Patescibacteria group bacterium]